MPRSGISVVSCGVLGRDPLDFGVCAIKPLKWLHYRTSFAANLPLFFAQSSHRLRCRVKLGKIMTNMRQPAQIGRDHDGTRLRQRIATGRVEDKRAVISQLIGAVSRMVLVILTVMTPSILLAGTPVDTAQIAMLVALIAGLFIFFEYMGHASSLTEFRDAPPFNRVRFVGLFATVVSLTLIVKAQTEPTTMASLARLVGGQLAQVMDFPYSPVRLVVLLFPADVDLRLLNNVRIAAGVSYFVSLLSLGVFVLALRLRDWPNQQGGFNIWTNLPTFNPTVGGDVVARLERGGQINLILGFLLPFLIPAFVALTSDFVNPIQLKEPHTLIWTMTAWAFIPASLIMRGIALLRVAQMVVFQREKAYMRPDMDGSVAAS